jgi:hypothetical protein
MKRGGMLWSYGPGALCRMDATLLRALSQRRVPAAPAVCSCVVILLGTCAYGFAFGVWRDAIQGLYSALKMPVLFFSVILASAAVNTILAQLIGSGLSFRQVFSALLFAMAVTALILGAVSPVVGFLVLQAPSPPPAAQGLSEQHPAALAAMRVYWRILLVHVGAIGFAGLIGNLRLYHLLAQLCSRRVAVRLLATWILITGFVGCQLSWLLSPFLCKPTQPPHIIAREYFQENFYERVWRAISQH